MRTYVLCGIISNCLFFNFLHVYVRNPFNLEVVLCTFQYGTYITEYEDACGVKWRKPSLHKVHGRPPALDCRGPIPLPLSISPRLHLLLLRPPQMTGDDERERERHERRGVTELGQWGEEGRVRCPYLKKKLRFPLLNHHRTIGLHSFRAWNWSGRVPGVSTERKSAVGGGGRSGVGRPSLTVLAALTWGGVWTICLFGTLGEGNRVHLVKKRRRNKKNWIGLKSKSGSVEREGLWIQ